MENLLIVGAGGYGRVVWSQCMGDAGRGKDWQIHGFLDDRADALQGFNIDVPIVGDPQRYVPQPNDSFICALGDPRMKRKYAEPLLAKNAYFINLMTDVSLGLNVKLGQGIIFELRGQVAPGTTIGDFVTLGSMAIVGHDVSIGAYSFINAFAFVGSGSQLGEGVTVHPHATILPGRKIGAGATIGAGSVVVTNVPAGATFFGNPAKKLQVR